jgi:hypothetical protein
VFVSAAIGSCIGRIVGDGGYRRPQGMAPEDLGLARVTSRGRYRGGSGGRLHRVRRRGATAVSTRLSDSRIRLLDRSGEVLRTDR